MARALCGARDTIIYLPSSRTLQMMLFNWLVRLTVLVARPAPPLTVGFSRSLHLCRAPWFPHTPTWVSYHGKSPPHPRTPRFPVVGPTGSLTHSSPGTHPPGLISLSRPPIPHWFSASNGPSDSKLPLPLLHLNHILCWFLWPQTNGPPHRSIPTSHCILNLASRPELELFYYCFPSQTFKNNICPGRVSVSPRPPRWRLSAMNHLRCSLSPSHRRPVLCLRLASCRGVSAVIPR